MRNVTFGACPQQPTTPFDKWVQTCLNQIQTSSRQDQVTNVGNSGQALVSITNATANTIPLFTSPTAATAISCTPAAQTFLSESTSAGMLAALGVQTETPFSNGIYSSGTLTPSPTSSLKQTLIANGAFAIAAPSAVGDIELYITNSGSASTITFSNFTKQLAGDTYAGTSGSEFVVFIYGFQNEAGSARSAYVIKNIQ